MNTGEKIPFFEPSHVVKNEPWGGDENKVSSIAFNVPEGTSPEDIAYSYVLKEPQSKNYIDALSDKFPPQNESEG